jgi:hypothetical protein
MIHPWSETNTAKLFLRLVIQEQAVTVSLLQTSLFLECVVKDFVYCRLQIKREVCEMVIGLSKKHSGGT